MNTDLELKCSLHGSLITNIIAHQDCLRIIFTMAKYFTWRIQSWSRTIHHISVWQKAHLSKMLKLFAYIEVALATYGSHVEVHSKLIRWYCCQSMYDTTCITRCSYKCSVFTTLLSTLWNWNLKGNYYKYYKGNSNSITFILNHWQVNDFMLLL